jgi:hypothetical protein
MSDARTARKIAMIENTLATNADVLSPAQIDSLKATIANLKATGEAFPGATAARLGNLTARIPAPAVIDVVPVSAVTMPVPAATLPPVTSPALAPTPVAPALPRPTAASLTAGKARFDAMSADGKVFTFEVSKPDRFKGEFFASVYSSDAGKFLYVAMMNGATGALRFTGGSKVTADDVKAKVLVWALGKVYSGAALPAGYSIVERTVDRTPAKRVGYGRRNYAVRSGAAAIRRAAVQARTGMMGGMGA